MAKCAPTELNMRFFSVENAKLGNRIDDCDGEYNER